MEKVERLRQELAEAQEEARVEREAATREVLISFAGAIKEALDVEEFVAQVWAINKPSPVASVSREIGAPYRPADEVCVPSALFAGAFETVSGSGEHEILEALFDVKFYRSPYREGADLWFGHGLGEELAHLVVAWRIPGAPTGDLRESTL